MAPLDLNRMGCNRWCRPMVSITPTHTLRSRLRRGVTRLDSGHQSMRRGLIQLVTISINIHHRRNRTVLIQAWHRGNVRSRRRRRIGNLRRRQSAQERHRTGIRRSHLLVRPKVTIPIRVRREVSHRSVFRRPIQTTDTTITVTTPTGTMTVNTKTTSSRIHPSAAVRG